MNAEQLEHFVDALEAASAADDSTLLCKLTRIAYRMKNAQDAGRNGYVETAVRHEHSADAMTAALRERILSRSK